LSSVTDHIGHIHSKLQQLLKQYDVLQRENAKQQQLIEGMQRELDSQKTTIEDVQQQNLILKASVTNMAENEKKELERKIQHFIKNIDKCISLLSQ
jgi:cell division septum initiation protein DivIVA